MVVSCAHNILESITQKRYNQYDKPNNGTKYL